MVHNGIEYGLMAAYAEGLGVLRDANIGKRTHEIDAETTPLRDPEHYQYDLNLPDIAEVWRRGSVIASWLLDLMANALINDPSLAEFEGRVSDSGEGRWTIKAAIDEAVPAHVLTAALYERFTSRGEADFRTNCSRRCDTSSAGISRNPQNEEDSYEVPHSDALVFFGATGDLAYKKIFPSLQAMVKCGHFNVPVIGVARANWTSINCGRGHGTASSNTGESIPRLSTGCAAYCDMFRVITTTPATFQPIRKELGSAQHRRTISRFRPCSSRG